MGAPLTDPRSASLAGGSKFVLLFACLLLAVPRICQAAQPTAGMNTGGLAGLDWLIIALYACATISLGWFYSRRQSSMKEYFIGSGNLNPVLVGVSLFATLLSTISYLSMPGEAAGKGPVNVIRLAAYPLVFLVVAYVLLPVYMRQRVTSAYELLEERLGLSIRLLGASLFLVLRLVWMTLLVYLASKAMTVMLGFDYWIIRLDDWSVHTARFMDAVDPAELPGIIRWQGSELRVASVPVIVAFTAVVSVTYTMLGGLRAVVVTDLMQTILLFGGALLVILTVSWDFGGVSWFPTTWQENWDTQPFFSFDLKTRVTVVGTVLTVFIWYVATAAGDQTSVQRFMSTRDASAARRALATQLTVGALVAITLYSVGFALLGYFEQHPEALPPDMNVKNDADDLFPRFIAFHLPVGVSGVVVAAMFAAAMSSIDSGVNSITAVVMTDFVERLGWRKKPSAAKPSTAGASGHGLDESESSNTESSSRGSPSRGSPSDDIRFARILAVTIGIIVVLGSTYMRFIPGNITAMTSKTVNLLTTPIFSLFFFALFVPFSTTIGVWIGSLCGITTAVAIAFSGPLVALLATRFGVDPALFNVELIEVIDPVTGRTRQTAEDPISFQWISPFAIVVNITVGTVVSWLTRGRSAPIDK